MEVFFNVLPKDDSFKNIYIYMYVKYIRLPIFRRIPVADLLPCRKYEYAHQRINLFNLLFFLDLYCG